MKLDISLGAVICCLWAAIPGGLAADIMESKEAVTLAILPFEVQTGGTNALHWRTSIPKLLDIQLGTICALPVIFVRHREPSIHHHRCLTVGRVAEEAFCAYIRGSIWNGSNPLR